MSESEIAERLRQAAGYLRRKYYAGQTSADVDCNAWADLLDDARDEINRLTQNAAQPAA